MRMIRFEAKNVMMNEKGSVVRYAIIRRSIPNKMKKIATSARATWITHHGMAFSITCHLVLVSLKQYCRRRYRDRVFFGKLAGQHPPTLQTE